MKILYRPVPYGGGISKDGHRIYIDPMLKKTLKIDSFHIRVPKFTAYHESRERKLMVDKGWSYAKAHHHALKYENSKLRELGLNDKQIAAYQEHVIKLCNKAYHAGKGAPKDLFTGPYADEREDMVLKPGHHHRTVKKSLAID